VIEARALKDRVALCGVRVGPGPQDRRDPSRPLPADHHRAHPADGLDPDDERIGVLVEKLLRQPPRAQPAASHRRVLGAQGHELDRVLGDAGTQSAGQLEEQPDRAFLARARRCVVGDDHNGRWIAAAGRLRDDICRSNEVFDRHGVEKYDVPSLLEVPEDVHGRGLLLLRSGHPVLKLIPKLARVILNHLEINPTGPRRVNTRDGRPLRRAGTQQQLAGNRSRSKHGLSIGSP
jgi:hypothetical protein